MEDLSLLIRRCKRAGEPKISFASKSLLSIPPDVFGLTHLQALDLSNNKITSIDSKIVQLKDLRLLDLSNNSIMELSQDILKLENLQQLDLNNNPLSKQFEMLLDPKNQQQPSLRSALYRAFNMEDSNFQHEQMNVSKLIDIESKLKEERKRNDQLSKQVSHSSFSGIMEVEATEFDVGEIVQQGGFSIVHKASFRGADVIKPFSIFQKVALKKIFNPNITPMLMEEINNEINMLATLRHPSIILLMAVCMKPPNLLIATEFMHKGSLFNLLHKTKFQLKDSQKLTLALQTAKVLNYLHLSGIVHRDIKSHNILLDENFNVKLCDFGLARRTSDLNTGSSQFSGTPTYMAPELFQKKAYGQGVDLFAYGTLLWELFAREVPYEGLEAQDIMQRVVKGDSLQAKCVPKPILQLVNDLRSREEKQRPSLSVVVSQLEGMQL